MRGMEPNSAHYSIDYLNQIAPSQKRSFANDKMFLLIIGGVLLLAIIGGLFMFGAFGRGPDLTTRLENVSANLTTLEKISRNASSQNSISSNRLRSLNASLVAQLTTTNSQITEPLKDNHVPTKLPQKIVDDNAKTDLVAKLQDASLNGRSVFDRVYSVNMNYQLESLLIELTSIDKETSSKSLKSFIKDTKANLGPLQEQFSEFARTNTN